MKKSSIQFIKYIIFGFIIFGLPTNGFAQGQKVVVAKKLLDKIVIDGVLDEEAWDKNEHVAKDFITQRPTPGIAPTHPTEVKVYFDNEALYISAIMFESSKDSIMQELTARDRIGNTDFIGVIIDTYGNGNSAFEFILSSTEVQFDAKVTPQNEDENWDAVWFGETQLNDNSWTAELKIPYSAIRFPQQDIQQWNINFFRRRSLYGEQSTWSEIDPEVNNPWLTQMGRMEGIKNIKSPVRFSLSPYASVYALHSHDVQRTPINSTGFSYNLGLDVKYGINDAYTLDMTLIPDFGQVQSDDNVLNLSPFEIRFAERRPFFTEGLEIFDKGNIFYSRRVGDNQQLYNATKISGRGKKGLGVGLFNAVAAEKNTVEVDEETGQEIESVDKPLTNYNIFVLDKDLKNNSSLSLTNTNVTRRGLDFHNANVTAVSFNINNKAQKYGFSGETNLSQLYNKTTKNVFGHKVNVHFGKLKGAFTYGVFANEVGEHYNPNDLGFLRLNNYRDIGIYGNINDYDGNDKLNRYGIWFNSRYRRIVNPDIFNFFSLNTGIWGQTKKQWNFDLWMNAKSSEQDIYEPRVEGKFYKRPAYVTVGYWWGSDNRKKLRIQNYANIRKYAADGWYNIGYGGSARYRFSNNFNLFLDIGLGDNNGERGFVNNEESGVIFGKRNQNVVSNVLGSSFIFNAKMGIDLRVRHYWSKVYYSEFYELHENGDLGSAQYSEFSDFSYSSFSVDLNFRWQIAPGSEFNINWKNNIAGSQGQEAIDFQSLNYRRDLNSLKVFPQSNSLSVKLVYFIDYNSSIRPWLGKGSE